MPRLAESFASPTASRCLPSSTASSPRAQRLTAAREQPGTGVSYRRRAVCAAARNFYDNALHDTIRGLACLRANRPKTSAACNRVPAVSHGQWRSVFRHHHLHRHAGLAFLGTAHLKHTGLASTQSEADERSTASAPFNASLTASSLCTPMRRLAEGGASTRGDLPVTVRRAEKIEEGPDSIEGHNER